MANKRWKVGDVLTWPVPATRARSGRFGVAVGTVVTARPHQLSVRFPARGSTGAGGSLGMVVPPTKLSRVIAANVPGVLIASMMREAWKTPVHHH